MCGVVQSTVPLCSWSNVYVLNVCEIVYVVYTYLRGKFLSTVFYAFHFGDDCVVYFTEMLPFRAVVPGPAASTSISPGILFEPDSLPSPQTCCSSQVILMQAQV